MCALALGVSLEPHVKPSVPTHDGIYKFVQVWVRHATARRATNLAEWVGQCWRGCDKFTAGVAAAGYAGRVNIKEEAGDGVAPTSMEFA